MSSDPLPALPGDDYVHCPVCVEPNDVTLNPDCPACGGHGYLTKDDLEKWYQIAYGYELPTAGATPT